MTRLFQDLPLNINTTLSLTADASHHLARVLRASVGDDLTLFNGQGGEYRATIKEISKKGTVVEVTEFIERDTESPIVITLAQGIARGEKMDFIIQKSVELGVSVICPLLTERCNVRLDAAREEKRLQHWRAVMISACEQSGRNRLPILAAPQSLPQWLEHTKADMQFVLSPHVQNKLSPPQTSPQSISILIGPEGGLSENEIQLALQNKFLPLNLGPRVLRTETASIAALAMLQYQFGDF